MGLNKLAEFFGILIGDGYLSKYGYQLGICFDKKRDNDYIKYLRNLILVLFNKEPRLVDRERSKELVLNSKEVFNKIKNLGFPTGLKRNIDIPNFILKNKRLSSSFIRGLFDTDGCITWDKRSIYAKHYPRITINTTSEKLNNKVYMLLKKKGFRVYLRKLIREPFKTLFYIELYGFSNLKKWKNLISSSNVRKLKKLMPR